MSRPLRLDNLITLLRNHQPAHWESDAPLVAVRITLRDPLILPDYITLKDARDIFRCHFTGSGTTYDHDGTAIPEDWIKACEDRATLESDPRAQATGAGSSCTPAVRQP